MLQRPLIREDSRLRRHRSQPQHRHRRQVPVRTLLTIPARRAMQMPTAETAQTMRAVQARRADRMLRPSEAALPAETADREHRNRQRPDRTAELREKGAAHEKRKTNAGGA